MSEWIQVAKLDDVPADGTFPATAGGEPVCLYNLDGEIFATHDTCTHGNASLADGFIVEGQIECPFHQGMFDIRTGKATAAPCNVEIKTYPVKVEAGLIWLKHA